MNSFANAPARPLARREPTSAGRTEISNTVVAMLIAANDSDAGAFDKAVAYIYPR